jgi:hypothetical protein
MHKFHYFSYGYPEQPSGPVYALYQPVLECFLLVVNDIDTAQRLKAYAPARYQVTVVRIDQAVNYTPNLIDNEVCEQWTLVNKNDVNLFENDSQGVVIASELTPATIGVPWDLIKEKQWLLALMFYIKFFDQITKDSYYKHVELAMNNLPLNDQLALGPKHIRESVLKEIYLGLDFNTIENNTAKYINSNRWVASDHKRFLKSYQ